MNPAATNLIADLVRRGVELAPGPDGGIRYRPAGAVGPDLRTAIVRHKADLLAFVYRLHAPPIPGGFWARAAAALLAGIDDAEHRAILRETFEHRAAVAEYDGGLSRDEAERVAFAELWTAHRSVSIQDAT